MTTTATTANCRVCDVELPLDTNGDHQGQGTHVIPDYNAGGHPTCDACGEALAAHLEPHEGEHADHPGSCVEAVRELIADAEQIIGHGGPVWNTRCPTPLCGVLYDEEADEPILCRACADGWPRCPVCGRSADVPHCGPSPIPAERRYMIAGPTRIEGASL